MTVVKNFGSFSSSNEILLGNDDVYQQVCKDLCNKLEKELEKVKLNPSPLNHSPESLEEDIAKLKKLIKEYIREEKLNELGI